MSDLIKSLKAKKEEYIYLSQEYEAGTVNFRVKRPKVKDVLKYMESYPRAFKLVQEGMPLGEEEEVTEPTTVLEMLSSAEETIELFQKLVLATTEYQIEGDETWYKFAEDDEERLAPADLGGETVVRIGQVVFQGLARIGS